MQDIFSSVNHFIVFRNEAISFTSVFIFLNYEVSFEIAKRLNLLFQSFLSYTLQKQNDRIMLVLILIHTSFFSYRLWQIYLPE